MHYYFESCEASVPNYLAMLERGANNVITPGMSKKSAEVGEPRNAPSSERRQKYA